jgi:hypothetical protein
LFEPEPPSQATRNSSDIDTATKTRDARIPTSSKFDENITKLFTNLHLHSNPRANLYTLMLVIENPYSHIYCKDILGSKSRRKWGVEIMSRIR